MQGIPPAGTPVDQRLYNEACHRITELEGLLQEAIVILEEGCTIMENKNKHIRKALGWVRSTPHNAESARYAVHNLEQALKEEP